jgi:diketogulonate reductase-like aldo/keto reductase
LVDLFLIHTASGGKAARKEMWLALEKLHSARKAKSIGVSNWGIGHIEEMKEYAKIWPPHVNQIEACIRMLLFIYPDINRDISFTRGASNER